MNIIKRLFRRKSPKWETNFIGWIKTCSQKEMDDYLNSIELLNKGLKIEPVTIDMRTNMWGHSFCIRDQIRAFVYHGYGFHTSMIFGRRLRRGDILLKEFESGKIAKLCIIDIVFSQEPPDQFFAYVVPVGYVTDTITTKDLTDIDNARASRRTN